MIVPFPMADSISKEPPESSALSLMLISPNPFKQIVILQQPSGIPDHHEDAASDDDAEGLCQAVKEKIAKVTGQVNTEKYGK